MTEPDFSKMSTREILEWQYKNKPQIGKECELIGVEKQVWESTLNRSMALQAENDKLKAENESLKADRENYVELCERLLTISEKEWENLVKTGSRKQQLEWLNNHTKTSFINLLNLYECQKEDCKALAQKLLQVKPELRDWLETNFKEYL